MKYALGLIFVSSFAVLGCASTPDYQKITAQYADCGGTQAHLVEFTEHDWYKSWYAHCGGKEYFCRYSPKNENGWNGCRLTDKDQ